MQYAVLSSLTLLVGSLGRGAIGEAIDNTATPPSSASPPLIGRIAVACVVFEWIRVAWNDRAAPTA